MLKRDDNASKNLDVLTIGLNIQYTIIILI